MSRAHPTDLATRIQTQAYHLWEAAGRPPGDGFHFWLEAERMILHPPSPPDTKAKPKREAKSPTPVKKASRGTPPKKAAKLVKTKKEAVGKKEKGEKKTKKKKGKD